MTGTNRTLNFYLGGNAHFQLLEAAFVVGVMLHKVFTMQKPIMHRISQ